MSFLEDGPVVDVKPHRWEFCSHCETFMVVCADCGNNGCNGGSGDGCGDRCSDAHAKEAAAWKIINEVRARRELRRLERVVELDGAP